MLNALKLLSGKMTLKSWIFNRLKADLLMCLSLRLILPIPRNCFAKYNDQSIQGKEIPGAFVLYCFRLVVLSTQ